MGQTCKLLFLIWMVVPCFCRAVLTVPQHRSKTFLTVEQLTTPLIKSMGALIESIEAFLYVLYACWFIWCVCGLNHLAQERSYWSQLLCEAYKPSEALCFRYVSTAQCSSAVHTSTTSIFANFFIFGFVNTDGLRISGLFSCIWIKEQGCCLM